MRWVNKVVSTHHDLKNNNPHKQCKINLRKGFQIEKKKKKGQQKTTSNVSAANPLRAFQIGKRTSGSLKIWRSGYKPTGWLRIQGLFLYIYFLSSFCCQKFKKKYLLSISWLGSQTTQKRKIIVFVFYILKKKKR